MYEIKSSDDINGVQIVTIDDSSNSDNDESFSQCNALDIDEYVEDFMSDFLDDHFLDDFLNELIQGVIHECYENHMLDIIADEADDRMNFRLYTTHK